MKMSQISVVDEVRVYDGDLAYYDDWAIANGYEKRMDMRTLMFENGSSEEEVDEEEDRLWELFVDWCDERGLTAMNI